MRLCLLLCLCCAVHFGDGYIISPKKSSILYKTKQKDITIKILIHIDKDASKKMVAEYKTKYRRKLKDAVRGILEDARTLLLHPSLNQTVRFKLLGIQFLRSARFVSANEDATKYLASYCDWQSRRKFEGVHYSILWSGLDLYYMNGGKKVRRSTGRSYQSGVCSYRKSCALLQWDKKNMAYLVAHELGHSLGMSHDGFQNRCPDQKYIMASKYDKAHHPKVWSSCSQKYVKQFLQNRKSWCIK